MKYYATQLSDHVKNIFRLKLQKNKNIQTQLKNYSKCEIDNLQIIFFATWRLFVRQTDTLILRLRMALLSAWKQPAPSTKWYKINIT